MSSSPNYRLEPCAIPVLCQGGAGCCRETELDVSKERSPSPSSDFPISQPTFYWQKVTRNQFQKKGSLSSPCSYCKESFRTVV